jgi:hypothetical protein
MGPGVRRDDGFFEGNDAAQVAGMTVLRVMMGAVRRGDGFEDNDARPQGARSSLK